MAEFFLSKNLLSWNLLFESFENLPEIDDEKINYENFS